MTTGSFIRTDLNQLHNVVQNTQNAQIKDTISGILRDEFSKDSYYSFVRDEFGFPKTPDLTNVPLDAGFNDDQTTRIFIGEHFRHDAIFYPALLVKMGSMSSIPISINRNKETVKYATTKVIDGYGNEKLFSVPTHYVFAGAWEGSVSIDIYARDIEARDELESTTSIILKDIRYEELLRAGIAVKKVSISGPSESQDRQQHPLFKSTVSLDIRTEWRREIPVESTMDAINICVEFGRLNVNPPVISPNLTINTQVQLLDLIDDL